MVKPISTTFRQKSRLVFSFLIICLLSAPALFAQQPPSVTPTNDSKTIIAPVVPESVLASAVPTKISLDFKDADIGTVLRVISLKSGVNIVAGPEVVGLVTIRLEEVEWEKALDVILRTYNYVYEKDGNVIRVTTRDKMQQEPVDTKTFILNYAKASEVMLSVQDILTERGRVKTSERMNMLIVTDIPTNIFHIGQVIARVDKINPQAYIDSKIVSTNVGLAEDLGIAWSPQASVTGSSRPTTLPFPSSGDHTLSSLQQFFPLQSASTTDVVNPTNPRDFPLPGLDAGTATYSYGTLSFASFSAIFKMLKTDSRTKVISNPRVVVLNNQEAKVQVGSQIPIPQYTVSTTTGATEVSGFSYRDIGVVLKVTPHINDVNEIMVDLQPEVSSKGVDQTFSTSYTAPTFNITTAKTQVMMKSGETIAIGGLLTDNDSSVETKIPYLGDIPLVGKLLFKSKRQTVGAGNEKVETLFFVTVTSVDSRGQPISDSDRKDDSSSQDQAKAPDHKAASPNAPSAANAQKTAA